MATPEENTEIVRRYYEEAFNEERTDLLDELIAEDVVNSRSAIRRDAHGRGGAGV